MRDIRSDLQERLQATMRQRTELGKRLRSLEVREQRLRALLQDEELARRQSRLLSAPTHGDGVRLREFVLGTLDDGHAWTLEALKEQARGLGLTTVGATGRSLNITLVNLLREDLVMRLADGRWRLGNQGAQLALDLTSSSENSDPAAGEARLAS